MFRDLLMSLGLLHIEISKDGKRIEYVKGSIEDIKELIEKSKPMSNMKNIPGKIYLQIGDECDSEDFNELSEVSWCKDKIYDNDIEYTLQNQMDNITEKEIKNMEDILLHFNEAHNMLAKTSLSKEEYQPISGLLAKAKVELFNFYNEHKALKNKVSDEAKITSECKDPNCEYCHGTGEIKIDNPTSMIISYCECFGNGTMSSVPHREEPYKNHKVRDISAKGESEFELLLKVKNELLEADKLPFSECVEANKNILNFVSIKRKPIVNERKDNSGVNDAIEFADWINKNASRNAVGSCMYFGNMFYTKTSKELYDIFKSELQPQQKEVDGYDDEM